MEGKHFNWRECDIGSLLFEFCQEMKDGTVMPDVIRRESQVSDNIGD
jgi:hypothetical protein